MLNAVTPESSAAGTKKNLQLVQDPDGNFYQTNFREYRFNQMLGFLAGKNSPSASGISRTERTSEFGSSAVVLSFTK